jgi:hypothetical protein
MAYVIKTENQFGEVGYYSYDYFVGVKPFWTDKLVYAKKFTTLAEAKAYTATDKFKECSGHFDGNEFQPFSPRFVTPVNSTLDMRMTPVYLTYERVRK